MNSPRDDEALGWAGDDDPTLQTGTETTDAGDSAGGGDMAPPPEGWTVAGPATAVREHEAALAAAAPVSSVALIAMGVFGGVYLLYTIGWVIGVSRIGNPLSDAVGQFMFSLGLWLAVAAPAVWFVTTLWLTRTRPRVRFAVLLLGVVLLAPLSFLINARGAS